MRGSDRWHDPAGERASAVDQRLVGGAPVVETALRVPGGQVLHRAWAVVHGGHDLAVVEIEDAGREPVGIALVVEGARRVGYRDRVVTVDGRAALVLPREPSRFVSDPDDGGDVEWRRDRRGGRVGFVFPLAHTARLRVAVPLARARRAPVVELAALPDADRVASGWQAHAQPPGSVRVEVADGRTTERFVADRAQLLVTVDDPRASPDEVARRAEALDRCGHHAVARRALHALLENLRARRWRGAAAALRAAAGHHRRTGEPLPEHLVGAVAQAAHELARRAADDPATPAAQLAAADLLEGAGQPDAADACRRLAPSRSHRPARPGPDDAATPSTAPGPVIDGPADRVLDLLDRLIDDGDADGGVVDLLPGLPDEWLGQPVEVHDAPTRAGRLSFAVRWHGPRPALLWETERPVRLTASRLDPDWTSDVHQPDGSVGLMHTRQRGEALLAPVEPAGGLPGVVAPLPAGTPAADAPEGGQLS